MYVKDVRRRCPSVGGLEIYIILVRLKAGEAELEAGHHGLVAKTPELPKPYSYRSAEKYGGVAIPAGHVDARKFPCLRLHPR